MYTYKEIDPGVWTVGIPSRTVGFIPISDHTSELTAALAVTALEIELKDDCIYFLNKKIERLEKTIREARDGMENKEI